MSVEDIASQSSVVFETRYTAWLKRQMRHFRIAFVISQQIKEVIANGHENLDKLMVAQTPQLLPAKIIKIGWPVSKL